MGYEYPPSAFAALAELSLSTEPGWHHERSARSVGRGEQTHDEARHRSCANCEELLFLQFQSPRRGTGQTGYHFCFLEYRETGGFAEQSWDRVCANFRERKTIAYGKTITTVYSHDPDLEEVPR